MKITTSLGKTFPLRLKYPCVLIGEEGVIVIATSPSAGIELSEDGVYFPADQGDTGDLTWLDCDYEIATSPVTITLENE